ncbi:MAG: hypothetical protein K2G32_02965 [Oscillospiraceae bacterium]|nr:hypothetical protein [Oscillospiraceae bacterium]
MKKPLAVLLLIVGALAVIFGLAFLYFVLFLYAGYIGILIDIAVTLAAGMGIDRLRGLFRNKYGLKAPLFLVCAYLSSIIGSIVDVAVVMHLNFEGFMGGLGELLLGDTWVITAVAFAAAGGLYLLISFIIEKSKVLPQK